MAPLWPFYGPISLLLLAQSWPFSVRTERARGDTHKPEAILPSLTLWLSPMSPRKSSHPTQHRWFSSVFLPSSTLSLFPNVPLLKPKKLDPISQAPSAPNTIGSGLLNRGPWILVIVACDIAYPFFGLRLRTAHLQK